MLVDVGWHSYIKLLIGVIIPLTVVHTCCEIMYGLKDILDNLYFIYIFFLCVCHIGDNFKKYMLVCGLLFQLFPLIILLSWFL